MVHIPKKQTLRKTRTTNTLRILRGLSKNQVSKVLGIQPSDVKCQCGRERVIYGTLESEQETDFASIRRTSVLASKHLDAIVTILAEHPDTYLDEIQALLALSFGVFIADSTLSRAVQSLLPDEKVIQKTIAERYCDKRVEWIVSMAENLSGEMLVFVDEITSDEIAEASTMPSTTDGIVKKSYPLIQGYSIIAALGLKGYIAHKIVKGNVDSTKFTNFIIQNVVSPHLIIYLCGCLAC